jgi:hypothetical protein
LLIAATPFFPVAGISSIQPLDHRAYRSIRLTKRSLPQNQARYTLRDHVS